MNTGRVDINNVLSQMRTMREQAQTGVANNVAPMGTQDAAIGRALDLKGPAKADFQNILSSAVNQVNDVQKQSAAMSKAYELGDTTVSLSDVMVNSQKASVSFQAMTQVRNKLVEAYQEVMNMPV